MKMNKQQTDNKINISLIKDKYQDYPKEFYDWCKKNKITKYPKIKENNNTASSQGLALLLHNKNMFTTRQDLQIFFSNIGIKSNDVIQSVNKIEQWGLKRGDIKGIYQIPFPYQLSQKQNIRKINIKKYISQNDKNKIIEFIKQNIKNDYIDVPNDKWQYGHKNPDVIADNKDNIILQPPIQAKYRDDYIFIDTLTKIPTPKYLIKHDFYPYSEEQQKIMFLFLQKKFGKK